MIQVQASPSRLLRRDDLTDASYFHSLVAIDAVFLVGFLIISGLCIRISVAGRSPRLPFAWLLASSIAYIIFLSMDLASNEKSIDVLSLNEAIHISDALIFFREIGFCTLFFAIASVFLKRHKLASESSGKPGTPANGADVLVIVFGVAIYSCLVISSIVMAGMSVWANALTLRVEEAPFGTYPESEIYKEAERQLRALNASYVATGAKCTVCIYVSFVALYCFAKARTWATSPSRDKALKWLASLLPPLCFAYMFHELWFTITMSPKLLHKVYNTIDEFHRATTAITVLQPIIPFLMSLVLIVVGLRQSWWNRTRDDSDELVKPHVLKV